MGKRGIHLSLNLLVIAILVITALAIVGCAKESNDYREFVLREGIAHFSCEYPLHYEITLISVTPNHDSTTVVFGTPTPDEYKDSTASSSEADIQGLPSIVYRCYGHTRLPGC